MAAVQAGCRRLVFASSIHAVSGYPVGWQVHPDQPVDPGDLYGVSKCFGEALARMTAEQESVSCIALRIDALEARIDKNWGREMRAAARKQARENLRALRKQRNQVAEWYGSMKTSSADSWDHIKKGFSDAYKALEDAWNKSEKEFGSNE